MFIIKRFSLKIRLGLWSGSILLLFVLFPPAVRGDGPVRGQSSFPNLAGCPVLPVDNIWNTPVDSLPVETNSNDYISTIGDTSSVHADFGSGDWPPGSGAPIGIPYLAVPPGQPGVAIHFTLYGSESDPGPYPIPATAPIEGGPASSGDRHVLVVRQGECRLYELYRAFPAGGGSWNAGSGAVFDLTANTLRPDGWTSADAAGLPILPGLVRYDEVAAGAINHALRFTAPHTRQAHTWPARHDASSLTGSQYPPMGQRFRLRADFDISGYSAPVQVILIALKKYGLILADNGSAWYISGAPDNRWDNDLLHELDNVHGSDFEAVDVSSLQVSAGSGQVRAFTLAVDPASRAIEPGQTTTYLAAVTPSGGFNMPVTLVASSPTLSLTVSPASMTFDPPAGLVSLVVTDTHPAHSLLSGRWYTLSLTASSASFIRTATVSLLVGGGRVYLPVILK